HIKDKKTNLPSKRVHVIRDLGNSANEEKFKCQEYGDVEMNVTDYFQKRYGIKLRYPHLPCLNIGGSERRVMLPAELAIVPEGQPFQETYLPTAEQTLKMLNFSTRQPRDIATSIVDDGMGLLGHNPPNKYFSAMGIEVAPEMAVVPARVLTPPVVMYRDTPVNINNGSWNLRGVRFATGATMRKLGVLVINDPLVRRRFEVDIKNCITSFQRVAYDSGMKVGDAVMSDVTLPSATSRNMADLNRALEPAFQQLQNKKVDIIMVLLESDSKHVYAAIKYTGDIKYGVNTVCAIKEKIQPLDVRYLANITLKFNLKLNGMNHVLSNKDLGDFLKGEDVMIVGCDVTHPSSGSLKGIPSIAAVVSSVDKQYTQYPASMGLQIGRLEMIQDLKTMIGERLRHWHEINGKWPQKIIVYRDGVSESQYQVIRDFEIPQIQAACAEIDPEYKPKLTVAVVAKKHQTRFFPTDERHADKTGNCVAGMVVDRGITAVHDFDFFLQAHSGLKGTSRPAHYYVVHDENGFTADTLQTLTYNLSFLYARCTKSVSYCTPAYYADRACDRARFYLSELIAPPPGTVRSDDLQKNFDLAKAVWEKGVHEKLRGTMFYL
ncbi:hypothetical protein RUND412_005228, partial [Rhizina undulata]